jgi:hypothetical protein
MRSERVPVRGVHIERADADHEEHDRELDHDHRRVEAGALVDALDQDDGDDQGDDQGGEIEERAGPEEMSDARIVVEGRVAQRHRQKPQQAFRMLRAAPEDADQVLEVVRPAMGHRRRRDGVLEDQVPADDPREQLAERRVRVGVRGAGDRSHRGELGVAQGREDARQACDHEGEHEGGTGRIVGRATREHEDAGADDGADAEAGQLDGAQDPPQAVVPLHLLEQQAQRFLREQATGHSVSPLI